MSSDLVVQPPPQEPTAPPPPPPPRRRRTALPWILLALLLIPVVACGVLFILAVGGISQAVNLVEDVLDGGQIVVRTDRSASVIVQMQELGRLESSTFTVEKVMEGGVEQPNELMNLLLGDRLLLVAHGQVTAGVDLTQLSEDDVQVALLGRSVQIRLPEAIVFASQLDNDQSYVYDRRTGLLTKGDPGLETEVRRVAEEEILRAACEAGILENANESAQRQIRLLLRSLEFDDIEFLSPRRTGPTGCE